MIHLKINGQDIEVKEGSSVLKAAEMAGVKVPALCYNEELGHFTSCMLCLVKDASNGRLFPSCSMTATEGMSVICLLYTSPSPRDRTRSRMPSSA